MTDDFARQATGLAEDPAILEILNDVCDMTGMGFAAVARVTDARWIACQVVDRIAFGLDPGGELDVQTTICDEIRRDGNHVVIDHVDLDEQWRTHPTPVIYGFKSYVSLPILLEDGSFFGTLCAIDPKPNKVNDPLVIARLKDMAQRAGSILSVALARSG